MFILHEREVKIKNNVGLHSKPVANFVNKAKKFKSSIWITSNESSVNAKSLLEVLSLGVVHGTNIKISADGIDEEQAVDCLIEFLENLE